MKSSLLFLRVAILSIIIGIILGAFGAHALKDFFSNYETDIWNKGIFYQLINSLGLILIILLIKNNLVKESKLAMSLLFLGIILFSGSLYVIALSNAFLDSNHWLKLIMGPLTPLGGTLIIISWIIIFLKVNYKSK